MSREENVARRGSRSAALLPRPAVLHAGSVAGFAAFVLGFSVTWLFESHRVRRPTRPIVDIAVTSVDVTYEATVGPTGPMPNAFEFTAWQYLSLHHVGFEWRHTAIENLTPEPAAPLMFVPPLVLLGAGYAVVAWRGASTPRRAIANGGTVAVGYLPAGVFTAEASTWSAPPDAMLVEYTGVETGVSALGTVGTSTTDAALLAGIAFPVAFGAAGGLISFLRTRRR